MAINVTKPSVNLREKLNELETNKGLKGNEILQAETAQEVRSLIGAGRKNLIINGGMDVWQRGTSFTNPSANTYMADRFFTAGARVATTITKNTGVSVNGKVVNTLRIDATGADTWDFYQGIEAYQTISGQEVTISFWYKTNVAGIVCRHHSTGTYGSPLNSDSTWNKFEVTVTLPTLVSAGAGVNKTSFGWWAKSGGVSAGSFLEIANVQLELGSVATDFEHRSYGEELALCQRYYQKISSNGLVYTTYSTTQGYMQVPTPVQMRVLPSISWNTVDRVALASTSNITTNITYWSSYSNSPSSFFAFQARSSVALTSGLTYVMFPTAVTYMALNAEL